MLEQIKVHLGLSCLVHDVHDVAVVGSSVEVELPLVKVIGIVEKRVEAMVISEVLRATVVDSALESVVFEIRGAPEKMDVFVEMMRPLGLVEVDRTGMAAIMRGK